MSRVEPKYKEKFAAITSKTYKDQAIWFLNGFWEQHQNEAENIWKFAQKFIELDQKKGQGNDLDEFYSHKFLESLGETLTVMALRERLRQIDVDNNNRMALIEYLMFKYSKSVEQVVNAPQSDNKEELELAQRKVDAAQKAFAEMQSRLEEQKQALESQKKAEEGARKAEALAKEAENENKAALAELHKQEEDYKNRIAALEKASQEGTVVQKNKAANELAQLKGEDPLPLRKAKITQESAVRKAEKTRKEAEQATAQAKARTLEAEEKTRQVELAVQESNKRVQEALDFLDEVKAKGGSSAGAIWFMQRELKEAQKYLPKSKQTLI